MKRLFASAIVTAFVSANISSAAPSAPFSPEDWPASKNAQKKVHYVSTEGTFAPPSANWSADELRILSGGDQVTQPITIGGHRGVKVTGNYLNIADSSFQEWADDGTIDILMQVYGDAALLNAAGQPRNFNFLTGTLPELNAPAGGTIPVEAKNQQWNWVLFRIPNGTRPSDGTHYVGSIPGNAQGSTQFGGVNGGTIRVQAVPGLIVRVIAFGEQGAFGEPEQVNVFAAGQACDPEPPTNLVFIDFNKNMTNHLVVLNNGDQMVTFQDNVGPAGDKRRAVRANGSYMNFGITDNYLGKPCNDPRAVKVCVDFYDDPALTGAVFGPEAYATDSTTGVGQYPAERRHTLEGSGKWVRRSFTVGSVNLRGVNATGFTAGPRWIFDKGSVFISSVDIAVLRTGNHSLAGQDPLAGCVEDPKICTDAYGSYAELDLGKDIRNGLAPGNSGGDQEMIQSEAGPANDRRMAIRPARDDGSPGFGHIYMNFAITDEALGPSSQPNARLAICVTYYDDPALGAATFRPEVYQSDRAGQVTLAFTAAASAVALEGADKWRDAYFEIPDMKFNGVNQGPQAAARFVFTGKVFFSRLRYAVIRPCGPKAGINLLAECNPTAAPQLLFAFGANKALRLAWPSTATGFVLQQTASLGPAQWTAVSTTPVVEGSQNVVTLPATAPRFYRLAK
ncbi:MAG: hypothetical protein FJ403_03870 [Verrucomicrobia bacterium]|nr:hypothetical protein [Verrucomicrobiota bacterium]